MNVIIEKKQRKKYGWRDGLWKGRGYGWTLQINKYFGGVEENASDGRGRKGGRVR